MKVFPVEAVQKFPIALIALVALAINPPTTQAAQLSFSGSVTGQWGLPENPSASTVLQNREGGNNNRLEWGTTENCSDCTPFNNYVQFNGGSFTAGVGSLFSLGQFKYQNGSVLDSFDGNFPLTVSLLFNDPVVKQQTFSFLFNILNTPNLTGDPVKDGDRLRFSTGLISSQTVKFQGVEYALELVGFSTDSGQSIVQEFNSPEGSISQASLFGKITPVAPACPFQ